MTRAPPRAGSVSNRLLESMAEKEMTREAAWPEAIPVLLLSNRKRFPKDFRSVRFLALDDVLDLSVVQPRLTQLLGRHGDGSWSLDPSAQTQEDPAVGAPLACDTQGTSLSRMRNSATLIPARWFPALFQCGSSS